jgi:hypothetical protein
MKVITESVTRGVTVYVLYNFYASLELGSNMSMCNKALTNKVTKLPL